MRNRAAECRSKKNRQICKVTNYLSLCKQLRAMMVATEGSGTYSIVVVKVNIIICKPLLHTKLMLEIPMYPQYFWKK